MNKLTIILPSLNVANYIHTSINSVISQTLHNIEIICVDAGSTDGTLEILREYEKKDKRIKVIVSDIKSYGYQMNLGIQAAGGKYIGIVETDDFIDKNMFYCLYALAEKYDVDFVKSGYKQFVTNETRNIINYENARVLSDEYIKKIFLLARILGLTKLKEHHFRIQVFLFLLDYLLIAVYILMMHFIVTGLIMKVLQLSLIIKLIA